MQLVSVKAKPFLKWAGGKTQLLSDIQKRLPFEMEIGKIKRYIEPFIGGGALFFYLAQNYQLEEIVISDINDELLIAYKTVREDVESLLEQLTRIKKLFLSLSDEDRDRFYYEQRDLFNQSRTEIEFTHFRSSWIRRTAQFIFLNHTCFNGLYRTNSKLHFNVPFGKYSQPGIFVENNLRAVSDILQNVEILKGDFEVCDELTDDKTFVYFDPPYRPISKTSSFSTYHKAEFTDSDQRRLAKLYRSLDSKGAKLLLSNSDPKNENPNDDFFDELYKGFRIERVKASRAINSNGAKRGQINELIIRNY
jgi:DNA adenine methylase